MPENNDNTSSLTPLETLQHAAAADLMANMSANNDGPPPSNNDAPPANNDAPPSNNDAPPANKPPRSFEQAMKEKYGVEKIEDLNEEWEKRFHKTVEVEKIVEKEKEVELPTETLKALVDYVKKGGKEKDFYETQFTDWDKKDVEALAKDSLKAKYPNATPKQLDILFKKEYNTVAPEDATEEELEEIELNSLKLSTDAEAFRADRKANQVKVLDIQPKTESAEDKASREAATEYKTKWDTKIVPEALNEFKDITYEVEFLDEAGNKLKFNASHIVNAEDKKIVEEITKDPTKIFSLYADKDGQLDPKKLAKAVYYAMNEDKIVRDIASKVSTDRQEEFIKKNLKNSDFKPMNTQANSGHKSDDQKVMEAFHVANGRNADGTSKY
jgi:hypothetical protein